MAVWWTIRQGFSGVKVLFVEYTVAGIAAPSVIRPLARQAISKSAPMEGCSPCDVCDRLPALWFECSMSEEGRDGLPCRVAGTLQTWFEEQIACSPQSA